MSRTYDDLYFIVFVLINLLVVFYNMCIICLNFGYINKYIFKYKI